MVAKHMGRGITEPQRRRWVNLIQDAADEAGLPTDAEFRSAFLAYVEWGTRLAVYFSGPDAVPPAEQPVPRWNWGSCRRIRGEARCGGFSAGRQSPLPYGLVRISRLWPFGSSKYAPRPPSLWLISPGRRW